MNTNNTPLAPRATNSATAPGRPGRPTAPPVLRPVSLWFPAPSSGFFMYEVPPVAWLVNTPPTPLLGPAGRRPEHPAGGRRVGSCGGHPQAERRCPWGGGRGNLNTQACGAERGQRQKAAPSLDVKFSFLPAKGFLDVCYSHSFLLMPCLPPVENAHLDVSGKPTRVLL